jgi:hypothetical protein
MAERLPDIDELSIADLKRLLLEALAKIAELTAQNAALREEIARLKGLKGRPVVKPSQPSGMERATSPKSSPRKGKRRRGRQARVAFEDRVLTAPVPAGSRFKGCEIYVVQDLEIRPRAIRYRRERWLTPDGRTVVAPLPVGTTGHFGPELRRFVVAQYHQGQVTVPRLAEQLRGFGLAISKRQVMRLLIAGQESFLDEAREVLRAGLSSAAWITVDDTVARHKAVNGFCTQIGNAHFAWFGTTGSKSRRNFLELLRAGHQDYAINAEALADMREHHLARLGIIALKGRYDPVGIATEAALWGSVRAHGFLGATAVVGDDAGQFNFGRHGLCRVHAERLVHRLDTFTDRQRTAQQRLRALIWWFYRDLKDYKANPSPRRRAQLRARFDRLFKQRTGFATLDRLLARLHAKKPELLLVLDHPQIPLHTNGSENDIRCQVIRRKISGGTRSDLGRDCRDAFLSLAKTCAKLGILFWDYLGNRLAAPAHREIPYLPSLVRHRCQSA